jgi:hypothetical protein
MSNNFKPRNEECTVSNSNGNQEEKNMESSRKGREECGE